MEGVLRRGGSGRRQVQLEAQGQEEEDYQRAQV